jgi:hypothetical protein
VGVRDLDHGSMKRFYQGSQQFVKTQWVTSKDMYKVSTLISTYGFGR